MAEYSIARSSSSKTTVLSGEECIFRLRDKSSVQLVEIADLHFHHASPMAFLDENASLVHGLCHAFFVAEDHPEWKVVVVGHADTSGDIRPNYELSRQRARCIQAILTGDKFQWRQIAAKAKTKDIQQTLKSLAKLYYWNCHVEDVDDRYGQKTTAAVKGFQREANCLLGSGLETDGIMGPESWEAMLDVYRFLLRKSGADIDSKWNFVENESGIYACGESFPLDQVGRDNYRSQENRRVEIFFGAAEDLTPLDPPVSVDVVLTSEQCILYDPAACAVDPVSKKSSVSVVHLSDQDEPLAGVHIRLLDSSGTPVGTFKSTNAKGWVHWIGLEAGEYEVEIVA